MPRPSVFLIGTRWFGVLGPCRHIIRELHAGGYAVYVFGKRDRHYAPYDEGLCELVEMRMQRSYSSLRSDVLDVARVGQLARRLRPVVVHSFNPKPALVAWAGCAGLSSTHLFIGMTGVGHTFIRARRMEPMVAGLLRGACNRASYVFFQNPDDVRLFQERQILTRGKARMFTGPGVDLERFGVTEAEIASRRDASPIEVVCVSRLIWQKGVREYLEAARRLSLSLGDGVRFTLVGEFDDEHPDRVDRGSIERAVDGGWIRHLPWTDDVPALLRRSHVNVLLSEREGAPRAILEASAMALPTVAFDTVGVRELVRHEVTGYLAAPGDVSQVVSYVQGLARDVARRERLGRAARRQIAEPLSLANATRAQLSMYRDVGCL